MKVWINGDFYDRDQAKASVFDAGFQHGVGLFETMQARGKHVFRLDDHLRRLRRFRGPSKKMPSPKLVYDSL